MKALVFEKSIGRYVAMKLVGGKRAARLATSPWAPLDPLSVRDVPEKALPTEEWVRVVPTLTGICGSDLSVLCAKGSPYFSPLTSTPFIPGHEIVGVISDLGRDVKNYEQREGLAPLSVGSRVILEPALGCRVRGIEPLCSACVRGQVALCRNVTRGSISAGIQTGYCRDTGGGWSENFVAHRSQLYPVPDEVSDRAAVLAEPLSCAMHGVRRMSVEDGGTVFVIGCGTIGLLTIAALRGQGCRARIVCVAKYDHQGRLAKELGADVALFPPDRSEARQGYGRWAEVLAADLYFPEIGRPTVIGGADTTFDCIGSSASIDASVRFTASGGSIVLVGMPGVPSNIDWTAIWYKELSLHAAYAYGLEGTNGSAAPLERPMHTCELALEFLKRQGRRLETLVGEPFSLFDYRQALKNALFAGASGAVKTVFRIAN